jgi:hypothetical protein
VSPRIVAWGAPHVHTRPATGALFHVKRPPDPAKMIPAPHPSNVRGPAALPPLTPWPQTPLPVPEARPLPLAPAGLLAPGTTHSGNPRHPPCTGEHRSFMSRGRLARWHVSRETAMDMRASTVSGHQPRIGTTMTGHLHSGPPTPRLHQGVDEWIRPSRKPQPTFDDAEGLLATPEFIDRAASQHGPTPFGHDRGPNRWDSYGQLALFRSSGLVCPSRSYTLALSGAESMCRVEQLLPGSAHPSNGLHHSALLTRAAGRDGAEQ